VNGIIVLDKPEGFTSHDAVAKLRGLLRERRVGHGGTLDPMATGVLPVFVGRATRAVEFFASADKEYIAGLRLGVTTDTRDTTGTVLSERAVHVTRAHLLAVLETFRGEREQTPPMYSAVKIDGQPLYKLARRGVEIERSARKITVSVIELLSGSGADWSVRFAVSKGTYIRELCAEIGEALGCGGVMSALRRTRAGIFGLGGAVTLGEIEARVKGGDMGFLLPTDALFSAYPAVTLDERQLKKCRNGAEFTDLVIEDGEFRAYDARGEFLALCAAKDGAARPIKSFFEV
jgi:tRNA pseudouridine55 synthase